MQNGYNFVRFEVTQNNGTQYAVVSRLLLVNFGPVAVFSESKVTTSSGKQLEKLENFHRAHLIFNFFSHQKLGLYGLMETLLKEKFS